MECYDYIRLDNISNREGITEFSIVDTKSIKDKIVIPGKFNGERLTHLFYIEPSLVDRVKEIVIPSSLCEIYNSALSRLVNLEKITFNDNYMTIELDNLANLKEVEINNKRRDRLISISFLNLPKLDTINIKYKPMGYNFGTVVNCPNLKVQQLMHSRLYKIDELAFDGIKDTKIILPKSIREIATNSFINSNNQEIELISYNKDLYIQKDNVYKSNCTLKIKGVLAIEHLREKCNVEEVNISKDIENKALKLSALGYKMNKYSIASTISEVDGALKLISEEKIREELNNTIRACITNITCSVYLISNGYNSIAYKLKGLAKEKFLYRNRKIDILEFEDLTCIVGMNFTVYNISKEHLLNNLEEYYDKDFKYLNIKPIKEFKIGDNKVKQVEKINNTLVVYQEDESKTIIKL